jgi:hypothetical protein
MVSNKGVESFNDLGGDIRRIGNNQIELTPPGSERIPPRPLMQLPDPRFRQVVEVDPRQCKSSRAGIHGMSMPFRKSTGQSDGQRSAACSKICPEPRGDTTSFVMVLKAIKGEINQELCLLTRNQCGRADLKIKVTPRTASDEMLKRNVIAKMPRPKTLQVQEGAVQSSG